MERVLRIITEYQWWIYGVLGLILIFYLRRAIMARRENARSIFKLEQEQAQARYNRSAGISAVILLVAVAVFLDHQSGADPTSPRDACANPDADHRTARRADPDADAAAAHDDADTQANPHPTEAPNAGDTHTRGGGHRHARSPTARLS